MKKIFWGFILGLSLSSIYLIYAWVNPTQNPPQGGGVLQTDSSGLNIITTTRVSSGNFLVTSGSVGIGTTAPGQKLHVAGQSVFGYISGSKTGVYIGNEDAYGGAPFIQGVSSAFGPNNLVINPAGGNVGIGTTNPQRAKLVVEDTIVSPINSPWGSGANNDAFGLMVYDPTPVDNTKRLYNIQGTVKELGATSVSGYRNGVHGLLVNSSETDWYLGGVLAQQSGPYNRAYGVVGWVKSCPSGYKCFSGFFGSDGGNYPFVIESGNVGIGTTAPEAKLDVRSFIQVKGSLTNQYSASGFNLKADETVNYWHIGYRGSLSNQQGSLAFWYYNGSNWIQPLVLTPSGRVGIHTQNPGSVFTIVNPNNPNEYIETFTDAGIHLRNTSLIADTGIATILVSTPSTRHVCHNQYNALSTCSSDAEYAPMEENVEEGDVVMISELENPIKDDEAPFVLKKANKPYSSLIMGVVTNEEKGASGIKKSYFYKPLGIYGYFKVKVSTINGEIKRGDFLTASNIPGVAMKMTKPGRTIGIALENYDKEEIGIIRFFANLSWVDPTINNE